MRGMECIKKNRIGLLLEMIFMKQVFHCSNFSVMIPPSKPKNIESMNSDYPDFSYFFTENIIHNSITSQTIWSPHIFEGNNFLLLGSSFMKTGVWKTFPSFTHSYHVIRLFLSNIPLNCPIFCFYSLAYGERWELFP